MNNNNKNYNQNNNNNNDNNDLLRDAPFRAIDAVFVENEEELSRIAEARHPNQNPLGVNLSQVLFDFIKTTLTNF